MKKAFISIAVFLLMSIEVMGQGVSLPFTLYGGTAEIEADTNITAYGLGTDLNGKQPLCFDSHGDYLIIRLSGEAKALAFSARTIGNLGTSSNLALEESENGTYWRVQAISSTVTGVQPAKIATDFRYELSPSTRYIKLVFSLAEGEEACKIAVGKIRIYDRKINIGSTGWGTYFTDEAYSLPEGLKGYIVSNDQAGELKITKRYDGNDPLHNIVPANTPLLINGPEETIHGYETANSDNIPVSNYLHGNLVSGEIAALEGNYHYYKLANGANGLGWYFGDSAGAGGVFTMKGFKAYLAIPYDPESSSPVRQAPSFDMIVEETEESGIATGLMDTECTEAAVKYVENGEIRIRKGEHVYTMMGMTVR